MTWNHFPLIVLCLTFFVSKFHGSELNSLFITTVWSKMKIYSLSLITEFFNLGSFFLKYFDVEMTWATDATLVLNERESNYLPFEINLAFMLKSSSYKSKSKKTFLYKKKILSWKWASSRNASFTSIWCCGQTIQLRPMIFWHKKSQT